MFGSPPGATCLEGSATADVAMSPLERRMFPSDAWDKTSRTPMSTLISSSPPAGEGAGPQKTLPSAAE